MADAARARHDNSLLLITIGFPPERSAGYIRPARLAKYLPRFGWTTVVLTSRVASAPAGEAVPGDCRIYRAPRMDVARWFARLRAVLARPFRPAAAAPGGEALASTGRSRLADSFLLPDAHALWVPGAVALGLWAVLRRRPRLLYATSPAASTLLVGAALRVLTRLPLVIEFRDPWMLNPFRTPRRWRWLDRLEAAMERYAVASAAHIVVTSQEYKRDLLARYPALAAAGVTFIPNGFDPEDFHDVEPRRFDRFTVVHSGNFYEARRPDAFVAAVEQLLRERPELRARLSVMLVGARNPDTAAAIARASLHDVIQQAGPVSHAESLSYICGADLLLLIPGPGDGTMPGKTYEYLAARRPIFALAEPGVVSAFVTANRLGVVVPPDDIGAIRAALLRLYQGITAGEYQHPDTTALEQRFSRLRIAGEVAEVLNHIAGRAAPGALAETYSRGRATRA